MNNVNDNIKKPLVILTGPTAVGKTELSIELAKSIDGEIISADSIQVYKYMDIGSAKIMPEEMQGIKHYLIDELSPEEEFNVYVFQKLAKQAMKEIYSKNKIPIITGGTGFYIQSVIYDIDFSEEKDNHKYRHKLEELGIKYGNEYLHDMLMEVDEESAKLIHFNNSKKIIRALEYYKNTGMKMSEHNREQKEKESPYNFCYCVLDRDREILYERIEKRVDMMLEAGLVKEVRGLLDMGVDRNLVSMQGLGYKEIVAYLNDEISLTEAVSIIKQETRHFAKRQLTWFRREKEVNWFKYELYNNNQKAMLNEIIELLKKKKCI